MKSALRILGIAALLSAAVCFAILHPRIAHGNPPIDCSGGGCVTTYAYDNSRDNVNGAETTFKATEFPTSFTIVSNSNLQGIVYAQPLYLAKAPTEPTQDLVLVATEENYVYGLDSNTLANMWAGPTDLNQGMYEEAVPDDLLPNGCISISPEVGVTGTPVVDLTGNFPDVLYVVSMHYNTHTLTFTQRLNEINVYDGSIVQTLDIPTAFGTLGLSFNAAIMNQRSALALSHDINGNPLIYVAWASFCDKPVNGYNGEVAVFTNTSGPGLHLLSAFNVTGGLSGEYEGGVWMSGGGPAVDDYGEDTPSDNVFFATGNGGFQFNGFSNASAYGQSVLQLTSSLGVAGFYTPEAWQILNNGSAVSVNSCVNDLNLPAPYPSMAKVCIPGDYDLGSGGFLLARPVNITLPNNDNFVVVGGGKEGVFFVLDPTQMTLNSSADTVDPCTTGGSGQTIQCFGAVQLPSYNNSSPESGPTGQRAQPAFWGGNANNDYVENTLYVGGSFDSEVRGYNMTTGGGGTFNATIPPYGYYAPSGGLEYPGASTVVSWNQPTGAPSDAVLWILNNDGYKSATPAGWGAFAALPSSYGVSFHYLNSDTSNGPGAVKFQIPTIAHGHIYVAGQVSGTVCTMPGSCSGEIVVWY
jgi:hypothetical protein